MKLKTNANKTVKTKDHVETAEEKRLRSITAKKKQYKSHKNAIKAALANIDTATNKKVVFQDEEESDHHDSNETVPRKNGDISRKRDLFDDSNDESEDEYNFEVKEQFQGKKGKKLMELQSKYKNDKRFMLDERFLEEEDDKSDNNGDQTTSVQENGIVENELIEEKRAELAILEEVLGKRVRRKLEESKKTTPKSMVRYDPSRPDHAELEVKNPEIKVSKKRKRKESDKPSEEEKKAAELPEVSKETFYEVKKDLKESLLENQPFSVLGMFGRNEEVVSEKDVQSAEAKSDEIIIEKDQVVKGKNPFKYDSSDNESETEDKNEMEKTEPVLPRQNVNLGPQKLWTEPFFFREDDYRCQEGFDFVRRFGVEDTEFSKVRRNIKEIVRAKVKHNQKKNRPFKKKLGGRKKMIKMKKALKR